MGLLTGMRYAGGICPDCGVVLQLCTIDMIRAPGCPDHGFPPAGLPEEDESESDICPKCGRCHICRRVLRDLQEQSRSACRQK